MESDDSNMYREHILELYKEPSNYGTIKNPTHQKTGNNPLCGDEITVQITVKGNKVEDIKFRARGCAISIASASLITDYAKGKSLNGIRSIGSEKVVDLLHIPISPVRLKCALLPLQTLHDAIGMKTEGKNGTARNK